MDTKKIKIKADHLSKKFSLLPSKDSKNKAKSLVDMNHKNEKDFWALRNISFEICDGECVGVIGLNGAGKSTLSNIISGQIAQTTGQVEINGDVSIIAANAGMQNNLSGRENIRLKALMMGMTNKEIKEKMDEIIEFSELGPFIDQPVKTYSSGMKAKLGFSIMVHQDPDIMIVDEALSVGDKTFVDKSRKKMLEFREQGKTILLVSHDMRTIKEWSDRVIWLNYGEVKAYGSPEEVIPQYTKFANWFKKLPKKDQKKYKTEQRQVQLDYSLEKLKAEITKAEPNMSRRDLIEVADGLKKQKDNHRLSIVSKLILAFCTVMFIWLSLVAVSNATFAQSVEHPRSFLKQRLLKAKPMKPMAGRDNSKGEKTPPPEEDKPVGRKKVRNDKKKASQKSKKSKKSSSSERSSSKNVVYTVETGDSLGSIADSYGISVESIEEANPGVDFSVINPGQRIKIPAAQNAQSATESETTQQTDGVSQ
ncbi:teichoic acid ABC transporter ATP-binding protein [Ligilactobacillus salitolerans]|uniref:Teichoic acid ABC transporter ATP-binding protein n=1 Tax=Ligilactobacillus salitolerans TaxID=1808352 RepID=A0A401ISN3_9LACO|nr:ATP-binding cassette domain-containing protein [Ligilactobacillus salitolerans]GBG94550.1 teichoic acid ABC transporter ATP-binding protein [Ligilactobacillus salitolerans]